MRREVIFEGRGQRQIRESGRVGVTAGTFLAIALLLGAGLLSCSQPVRNKIVLIGGDGVFAPGQHDWSHGVQLMEDMLRRSPQLAAHPEFEIEAYPYGWPSGDALQDAATIVFYFNGRDRNPLLDARPRDLIAKLMDRGVGLVALHQSFTLPESDTTVPIKDWVGAARYGYFNRTTKPALLNVADNGHPIARGLEDTVLVDEYFPTLEFSTSGKITPIWTAELPIHYQHSEPTVEFETQRYDVAWAYERENGGRSFAYVGAHFLATWDNPQLRTAFLNAVLWTAGIDVPEGGATTATAANAADLAEFPAGEYPRRLPEAIVSRSADDQRIEMPWGEIEWYVSGPLNNSKTMTVGMATVRPGESNPLHFHPNCDEILHVLSGRIAQIVGDETVEMSAGDTVSIPQGMLHKARNIGDVDAKLAITFNNGWREVVGE